MLQSFLNTFFGCSHRHLTFPQTPLRRSSAFSASGVARHGTYVTCLECGKELDYNWDDMRVGKPVERGPAPQTQPSYR